MTGCRRQPESETMESANDVTAIRQVAGAHLDYRFLYRVLFIRPLF